MFHKLRCRLAKRRFEKALDNVTEAEFKRICAIQNWFDSVRLLPGDKVTIAFNEFFTVDEVSRSNRNSELMSNPNDFTEL